MGAPGRFDPEKGVWYCSCECDPPREAVLTQCTQGEHQGMLFYGCPLYKITREKKGTCDMFVWQWKTQEIEKLARKGKITVGPPKQPVTPDPKNFYGRQQQPKLFGTTPVSPTSPSVRRSVSGVFRGVPLHYSAGSPISITAKRKRSAQDDVDNKTQDNLAPPTPSVTGTITEGMRSFNMGSDAGGDDDDDDDDNNNNNNEMGNHYASQQTLFTDAHSPRRQTTDCTPRQAHIHPETGLLLPPTPVTESRRFRNRLLIATEAQQSPAKRLKTLAGGASSCHDGNSQLLVIEEEIQKLKKMEAKLMEKVKDLVEENKALREDKKELRLENKEVREDNRLLREENKELRARCYGGPTMKEVEAAGYNSASQSTVNEETRVMTLYHEAEEA